MWSRHRWISRWLSVHKCGVGTGSTWLQGVPCSNWKCKIRWIQSSLWSYLKMQCTGDWKEKKSEFRLRYLVRDLGRIIRCSIEPVWYLPSNFDLAIGSLGSLISYVDLLADNSNYGNYSIDKYSLRTRLTWTRILACLG